MNTPARARPLPPTHTGEASNKADLGLLLAGFFYFYAKMFPLKTSVIRFAPFLARAHTHTLSLSLSLPLLLSLSLTLSLALSRSLALSVDLSINLID